jgi:Flp pilus assembly protein CpaB
MSSGRRILAILLLVGGFILIAVVIAVLFFQLRGDGEEQVVATADPNATATIISETTDPNATIDPNVTLEPSATVDPNATPVSPEPTTAPVETTGPLIEVVVSLQTVPRGWRMTEAELTTDFRRVEDVDENVITDIEDALGKYARTDIFQGETLTINSLVGDPRETGLSEYGPSSLIPEGALGMAVPMDRLSSVAYALAAGDNIDILLNFTIAEVDTEFQTLLQNSLYVFLAPTTAEGGETGASSLLVIEPFGRVEPLPNGEQSLIQPSESQRPVRVAIIIQNAKVIQVGPYEPAEEVQLATGTPTPAPGATATPQGGAPPTPTPIPPDVLVVALAPQQQLLLKYALESLADVDFALRPPNDPQIYTVQNVDLAYLLERFDIDPPIDFDFVPYPLDVTETPQPTDAQSGNSDGG